MSATPSLILSVNGKQYTPDKDMWLWQHIILIAVEHVADGADELTIEFDAWNEEESNFTILGQNIFAVGNLIELQSGYEGDIDFHHGRYEIVRHEPVFADNGRPSLTVRGYDAMHRMISPGSKQPRAFMNVDYDHEIIIEYSLLYGLMIEFEETPKNPQFEITRKKGHKIKSKDKRKAKETVSPSWIKRAGTTDLADLKMLCMRNGFASPRVRYDPKLGKDVLLCKRPNSLKDQTIDTDGKAHLWKWRHTLGAGNFEATVASSVFGAGPGDYQGDCTLSSFSPRYSTHGLALAVRLIAPTPDGEFRVVEMELKPGSKKPTLVFDGSNVEEIADYVEEEFKVFVSAVKGDAPDFKNPMADSTTVLVEVLGEYSKQTSEAEEVAVKLNKLGSDEMKEWWGREIAFRTLATNTGDLVEYATKWLEMRRNLWQRANFEFGNIQTTNKLDSYVVQPVVGVSPEYEGWWMIWDVTHTWTHGIHSVTGVANRVISERPPIPGLMDSSNVADKLSGEKWEAPGTAGTIAGAQ